MKKLLLLFIASLNYFLTIAQVNISSGAKWVTTGSVQLVLNNMNLVNNGNYNASTGTLKCIGAAANNIGGSALSLYDLEINKPGSTLTLQSNVTVSGKVNFVSGLLDLNQNTLNLGSNAFLDNENEISRIIAPNGGEAIITKSMNKPNNVNPGNLGAIFTSNSNLGSVVIKRGHKPQTGTGMQGSINRYYNIEPGAKKPTINLRLSYLDAELNGMVENSLVFFQSTNNGTGWSNISATARNTNNNWVENAGLKTFQLLTLSNPGIGNKIVQNDIAEATELLAKKLTVGPNPNNGNFWFSVAGIEKETLASLYTIDGRMVKQFRVFNLQQQKVTGVKPGIYILKIEGFAPFKILVQDNGTPSLNITPNTNPGKTY